MFGRFIIAFALIGTVTPASAQHWREQLAADHIVERDGKMIYEEAGVLKFVFPGYEPAQILTKTYSEAMADGSISRDTFVALTASVEMAILYAMYSVAYDVSASEFIAGFDFEELKAPVRNPDLELNFFMTGEGLRIEVVDTATGQRNSQTVTWAEVYGVE